MDKDAVADHMRIGQYHIAINYEAGSMGRELADMLPRLLEIWRISYRLNFNNNFCRGSGISLGRKEKTQNKNREKKQF
ncbi:hypothetical protein DGMP_06180 [Desulfomarina profundi]|uniref:Uncharacterized protein n=1 Tax=Desulfomarina profundi TaxID=2772557 RepID=A0A8D5FLL9_9BACT|nr:hypothetical protein DGMP_06180 [Desulfomarina profundi]